MKLNSRLIQKHIDVEREAQAIATEMERDFQRAEIVVKEAHEAFFTFAKTAASLQAHASLVIEPARVSQMIQMLAWRWFVRDARVALREETDSQLELPWK